MAGRPAANDMLPRCPEAKMLDQETALAGSTWSRKARQEEEPMCSTSRDPKNPVFLLVTRRTPIQPQRGGHLCGETPGWRGGQPRPRAIVWTSNSSCARKHLSRGTGVGLESLVGVLPSPEVTSAHPAAHLLHLTREPPFSNVHHAGGISEQKAQSCTSLKGPHLQRGNTERQEPLCLDTFSPLPQEKVLVNALSSGKIAPEEGGRVTFKSISLRGK